ncbi:hypothetical protein J3U99_09585 [Brucella pituitosa]|uniref:hypothetical protein n=1 Tax=Brucella pituitosa TaxID=571256 RepID=UPI000FB02E4D|nr:hypothetical protein [Brucella pituitosa]MCK4205018.1 hypothetical protein [Brucella pituitosa]
MKKIAFAITAIVLNTGAALAENPFVGQPEAMAAQDKAFVLPGRDVNFPARKLDFTSTAAITPATQVKEDGSAHRFGDASPSSFQN